MTLPKGGKEGRETCVSRRLTKRQIDYSTPVQSQFIKVTVFQWHKSLEPACLYILLWTAGQVMDEAETWRRHGFQLSSYIQA
jgi:hypothetical protein